MKMPSISTWTWAVALAAVACAVLLALSDAGLPESGWQTIFDSSTAPTLGPASPARPPR